MQRPLDAGTVVVAELSNTARHVLQVGLGDRLAAQEDLAARYARLRLAAKIEDDLEQPCRICPLVEGVVQVRRQRLRQQLDLRVPGPGGEPWFPTSFLIPGNGDR